MNISQDEFRRKLAGFCDSKENETDEVTYEKDLVKTCVVLAKHYNRSVLDPLKLWDRILSSLSSSIQKANGNGAAFLSIALVHVKAEYSRVAKDSDISELFAIFEKYDNQKLEEMAKYISDNSYLIILKGRAAWEEEKKVNLKSKLCRFCAEDEAAAREGGEKPSTLFNEEEVLEILENRKNIRKSK